MLLRSHGRNWSHGHSDVELRNPRCGAYKSKVSRCFSSYTHIESLPFILTFQTQRESPFASQITRTKTESSFASQVTHVHRFTHIDTSQESPVASQVTHTYGNLRSNGWLLTRIYIEKQRVTLDSYLSRSNGWLLTRIYVTPYVYRRIKHFLCHVESRSKISVTVAVDSQSHWWWR